MRRPNRSCVATRLYIICCNVWLSCVYCLSHGSRSSAWSCRLAHRFFLRRHPTLRPATRPSWRNTRRLTRPSPRSYASEEVSSRRRLRPSSRPILSSYVPASVSLLHTADAPSLPSRAAPRCVFTNAFPCIGSELPRPPLPLIAHFRSDA